MFLLPLEIQEKETTKLEVPWDFTKDHSEVQNVWKFLSINLAEARWISYKLKGHIDHIEQGYVEGQGVNLLSQLWKDPKLEQLIGEATSEDERETASEAKHQFYFLQGKVTLCAFNSIKHVTI